MRPCVIFNPAARGDKARRFRAALEQVANGAELRPTTGPGAARVLARQAVLDGFGTLIAAGGDGTVFEVLNGIADVPGGPDRTVLGVLPLGTANVLARELALPVDPLAAWSCLHPESAKVIQADLGVAEFMDSNGNPARAHFSIVAGAGLDARAVQLVDPASKRRWGKLAYVRAALRAWWAFPDSVRTRIGGREFRGRAVLAGNGRLYAGEIPLFGEGRLDSGVLHVRGVSRIHAGLLLRCLRAYLSGAWGGADGLVAGAEQTIYLESDHPTPLELDGEFVGWLPARLGVEPGRLKLLAPR